MTFRVALNKHEPHQTPSPAFSPLDLASAHPYCASCPFSRAFWNQSFLSLSLALITGSKARQWGLNISNWGLWDCCWWPSSVCGIQYRVGEESHKNVVGKGQARARRAGAGLRPGYSAEPICPIYTSVFYLGTIKVFFPIALTKRSAQREKKPSFHTHPSRK